MSDPTALPWLDGWLAQGGRLLCMLEPGEEVEQLGRPVSDETYVAQAFPPEGVGLRPFSVAHVEQPWRRPQPSIELRITPARLLLLQQHAFRDLQLEA